MLGVSGYQPSSAGITVFSLNQLSQSRIKNNTIENVGDESGPCLKNLEVY
jgi:hypothetical protein